MRSYAANDKYLRSVGWSTESMIRTPFSPLDLALHSRGLRGIRYRRFSLVNCQFPFASLCLPSLYSGPYFRRKASGPSSTPKLELRMSLVSDFSQSQSRWPVEVTGGVKAVTKSALTIVKSRLK